MARSLEPGTRLEATVILDESDKSKVHFASAVTVSWGELTSSKLKAMGKQLHAFLFQKLAPLYELCGAPPLLTPNLVPRGVPHRFGTKADCG